MFNDEELLFFNRLAFYVLQNEGSNINFKTFIGELEKFQEGSYEDKIYFLIGVCKDENGKVETEELINLLLSSMP